jgi:hypothetical protein
VWTVRIASFISISSGADWAGIEFFARCVNATHN